MVVGVEQLKTILLFFISCCRLEYVAIPEQNSPLDMVTWTSAVL